MSRTLIGIVSYGGLPFLELCLRSIRDTVTKSHDILVIVAKPDDFEMKMFLMERQISFVPHYQNMGFPASVNDLYDKAFTTGDYDNLIICGNDIVALPGAIDSLIQTADSTEFEMVCGSEYNARFLVNNYPEARKYFRGDNLIFSDFTARPWELHTERRYGIEPHQRKDVRNMTLFKRSSFEKVGYDDVNYWPNGYYADNDYCRRCDLAGVSACGVAEAVFFHFASRTIFQNIQRNHGGYSANNHWFFREAWGGDPGHETYSARFHGDTYKLGELILPGENRISTRDQEQAIIQYWSTR